MHVLIIEKYQKAVVSEDLDSLYQYIIDTNGLDGTIEEFKNCYGSSGFEEHIIYEDCENIDY